MSVNGIHSLGNGAGGLLASIAYAVGTAPISFASADFNHDGNPDLATANSGSNDVSILLGNGSGTFAPASPMPQAESLPCGGRRLQWRRR